MSSLDRPLESPIEPRTTATGPVSNTNHLNACRHPYPLIQVRATHTTAAQNRARHCGLRDHTLSFTRYPRVPLRSEIAHVIAVRDRQKCVVRDRPHACGQGPCMALRSGTAQDGVVRDSTCPRDQDRHNIAVRDRTRRCGPRLRMRLRSGTA